MQHAPKADATDAGRAALGMLADGLAPEPRGAFRKAVGVLVGTLHGEAGLPRWIGKEATDAHAAGQERRGRRFATVELIGAESVVLVRSPFPGDARAVVEAMGTARGVWNGDVYYPPHPIIRVRLGGREQL